MAEKIVSPGVFTRERDLSFLPAAIGEIGAAVIGPTVKGPAFEPTIIESFKEFEAVFGPKTKESYVPYTIEQYLKSAGRVTVVRVLGLSGYTANVAELVSNYGAFASATSKTTAVFHPTIVDENANFTVTSGSANDTTGSGFVFYLSASAADYNASTNTSVGITGHAVGDSTGITNLTGAKTGETAYSMSLDPTSANFVTKVFGKTPKDRKKPLYTYVFFGTHASRSIAASSAEGITSITGTAGGYSGTPKTIDLTTGYSTNRNEYEARTPFITSQMVGGKTTNLFKIHRRAHGTATNFEFKIVIDNIRSAGSIAGSDYGSFSLRLRRVDVDGSINAQLSPFPVSSDSDRRPEITEQFNNLTLDPNSPNFIARVIGDKYQAIDANGKVSIYGDYANLSRHIWVEVPESVKDQGTSPDLVPFGYAALVEPLPDTGFTGCPSASAIGYLNHTATKRTQILDNVYNNSLYYGFDYSEPDNHNYLKPLPDTDTTNGDNTAFNLSNEKQHPSASLDSGAGDTISPAGSTINLSTKKFAVPFQGGFDGFNPSRFVGLDTNITAANLFGYDLSTAEKDGALAYKRAINAVSNPDEYDINLMVTPGANHRLHSVTTTHAKNTCEDRGDAFYIMDSAAYGDNINTVTNTVKAFDSNYAATYYPWVKILDTDINKPVWVPPSVVVPGAIAYNDQVAFEWFAPAGLNRGSLTEVIETADRVTHEERDDLYEGRVNPIATFPGQGVCIWGQKTLQGKPSALDRVNVRRLLIAVKKFIASATRYLVFENNTSATRNRFLNIANPYLESVQQRQGLYAFKVIMDATNNTPDVIDRNQMVGELFLQPAKAAEFIVLDFNILPTGAAFPE
tara:strand:+ start:3106 stop:5667 length:2562 start_codon:yes stop_codon:yes gene_type:complete